MHTVFTLNYEPCGVVYNLSIKSNPFSLLFISPLQNVFQKNAADEKERLSKRKLKKLSRLSVAELKQLVSRPDVVEMYDVTARDPKLLVQLKAHRNTVQVPRHWCYKRKVRLHISLHNIMFIAIHLSHPVCLFV